MRVLLTGGTGFLGTRVLSLLGSHDVLVLSRNARPLPCGNGVKLLAADLTTTGHWVGEVVALQPECCMHLAWEGLPDYSLAHCRVNLDASLRLMDVVAKAGVKKIVVAGSCWEYGRATGAVSEEMQPQDVGVFASTKHALLSIVESVARTAPFDYSWARVFFAYGPGQRPSSLIPQLQAAYAQGRALDIREPAALQDFVHVDDVAAALVALAARDVPSGIFNVGTGNPKSVAYVANRAAAYYGAAPPFNGLPGGSGFWADTTKIANATGWRARIGIDAGIDSTLAALDGLA